MLKELLSILRGSPSGGISDDFKEMLDIAQKLVLDASAIYWGKEVSGEQKRELFKDDVKVNKLQRKIRKQLVTHLTSSGNVTDVPYGLLIMSLSKDVERMGDYAKNLVEVPGLNSEAFPQGEILDELKQIRIDVEDVVRRVQEAFVSNDTELSTSLIEKGRSVSKRCDLLVERIAASNYPASVAVAMVLGARYYKRIEAHVINLLTGVVMPLHKLDYYDERAIEPEAGGD